MRGCVKGHRSGPRFGLNVFDDREFVFRVFTDHGQGAFAVRAERKTGARVELGSVGAAPGRKIGDNFAIRRVHDDHLFVAAGDEEPVGPGVDRQSGRFFARGDRPTGGDFERFHVNDIDLALVLEIYEEPAASVTDSKFGLTGKGDRANGLTFGSVDHGRIVAAAVKAEHVTRSYVENNDVGILIGLDGTDQFEGLEVEDRNGVVTPVTRESSAKLSGNGDPVIPLVFGISPTTLSVSVSITTTCVA